MKTNFQDVQDFHEKFQVPQAALPSLLDPVTQEYREKFLEEELTELRDCYVVGDIEGVADALVDLVYVALGTAVMMKLPWQQLWDSVQVANMAKRMAKPDGSDSKRGSPLDVVKPPGWVGPDHKDALGLRNGSTHIFNAQAEMDRRARARQGQVLTTVVGQPSVIGSEWTEIKLTLIGRSVWVVHQGAYASQVELTEQLIELFGERSTLWFLARRVGGQLTLGDNIPEPPKGSKGNPTC